MVCKATTVILFGFVALAGCRGALETPAKLAEKDKLLSSQIWGSWVCEDDSIISFAPDGRMEHLFFTPIFDTDAGLWKIENGKLDLYYLLDSFDRDSDRHFIAFGFTDQADKEDIPIEIVESGTKLVFGESVWIRTDLLTSIFPHPLLNDNRGHHPLVHDRLNPPDHWNDEERE